MTHSLEDGRFEAYLSGTPFSDRGGSRTHKALRPPVFETGTIAHWSSFRQAVPVGVEPTAFPTTVVLQDSDNEMPTRAAPRERPGGFEPPHPPWQGGRLPGYIMDARLRAALQYPRQESNLHNLRLRRAACFRHTPGIKPSVPRPGIEPGLRPSEGRVMSVSPPRSRSSGGWSRANTCGFRARRPAVRRPRIRSVAREGLEPSCPGGTAF